jgi:hypothetical protein
MIAVVNTVIAIKNTKSIGTKPYRVSLLLMALYAIIRIWLSIDLCFFVSKETISVLVLLNSGFAVSLPDSKTPLNFNFPLYTY